MKKLVLAFVLFLQCCSVFGQTTDSLSREFQELGLSYIPSNTPGPVNQTDSLERKQGLWIDYIPHQYRDTNVFGFVHVNQYVSKYSFGKYQNGHKIGTWEYIHYDGDMGYPVKYEDYLPDGSVTVKEDNDTTTYNADSTRIMAKLDNWGRYMGVIVCIKDKKAGTGYGKILIDGHLFKQFKFEDFEVQLLSMHFHYYYRDISIFLEKYNKKGSKVGYKPDKDWPRK